MKKNKALPEEDIRLKVEIMEACNKAMTGGFISQDAKSAIFQALNPPVPTTKPSKCSGSPFILKGGGNE